MPNMQTFIMGIVVVGVTLIVGIFISSEISDQMTTGSAARNASDDLVDALAGGTAWITILVVVGFAVIVLGMLTQGLGSAAAGAQPAY